MISKFRCFLILTFVSTLSLLLFSFIMLYGGVRLHDQLYWKDSKNGLHLDAVSLSRVDQTTSHLRFPSEEKTTTVKGNYQASTVVTGINYMDGVSSFAPDRLGKIACTTSLLMSVPPGVSNKLPLHFKEVKNFILVVIQAGTLC